MTDAISLIRAKRDGRRLAGDDIRWLFEAYARHEVADEQMSALLAVAVVAGDGEPLLPCGRCRQLLLEAGGGDLLVDTAEGPVELKVLLPAAFTGTDLADRREAR